MHLTLRALLRDSPSWDVAGRAVHVCENASVVAVAADAVGAACTPPAAVWDVALADDMALRGVVVHEEAVVNALIADLAG